MKTSRRARGKGDRCVLCGGPCDQEATDNGNLIAEYRTAAPALADECERLRERVRVLEEALRPFGEASFGVSADHQLGALLKDAPVVFVSSWRSRVTHAPVFFGRDFSRARAALKAK